MNKVLLETARRDFPTYYAQGTPRERAWLDMLVITTGLIVALTENQETELNLRADTLIAARRSFDELVRCVRTSPTFSIIPMFEQMKLESALFERTMQ